MKNVLRLFVALIFSNIIFGQVSYFEGIQYSGERPPDPVIAVSNNYIVQAVNKKLAVFNKSGNKLFEQSFSVFFSDQTPPSAIFDPKVAYDQYSNRFILLAAGKNTGGGNSNYMLAVTQNSDPTGSWYKYKLDAEDQNLTQYDIDFPGLGYDEEAIYLTSHQYDDVQVSYYPKITILNKSEVYSGTITYRKDFKDFSSGGSYPAKLKPMRKFGTSSGYFIVNTESAGQIRIWKIENPLSSTNATRSVAATITLGSYSTILNATQKGTTNTVDIGDYSISDVVCIDGYLYGAYTAQNTTSNGSMIVYFKINTANNFDLMINGKIESPNNYYYYPVLHPDPNGNIVFVFNKSSSNDYIGIAWTIRYAGNPDIEPIQWLKQGTTWYYNLLNTRNRWGDYCGIALDPANGNRVWICGEWALTNTQWGTWIGEVSTGQTIDFYFTNTINDENTGILNINAGGTITVNSNEVDSGEPLPLETGNNYTELTNNERFANWNSLEYTYKHNHWNSDIDRKFLSNDFDASYLSIDQRAYFQSLNYTKIEARLEGQLITNKGAGKFQDPWYVKSDGTQPGDYWRDFTSFYEPNGKDGAPEKGVFLNQPYTGTNPVYYSVKADAVQDILLTQTGKTHRFYFQKWSRNFISGQPSAEFQDSMSLQTPVVFKNPNAIVNANLKGTQLSNTSTTYNNTSQNKFLKTSDGYLHNVYESLGDVYYEKSSDGGTTWVIMNDGKPINPYPDYAEAKSPAIACPNDGHDFIYITYQSTLSNSGISSPVVMLTQFANGNLHWHQEVYDLSGYSFSDDYQQVVAAMNNVVMVVFNAPTPLGFIAKEYLLSSSGSITTEYARTLPNVDVNSTLPSLVAGGGKYHLAYQQAAFSIRYLRWSVNSNPLISSYFSIPSTGSGYSLNTNPTVSLANLNPLISWKGGQYTGLREAVLRRGTLSGSNMIWGDYLKVGSNVNYIHNNSASSTTEKTVMSWSQDVSTTKWVKRTYPINGSTQYSSPANLSHTGINSQVSNGSDYNNMRANIFRSSAPLYYFTQSTTDFSAAQEEGGGGLNKITVDDTLVTFGRSGVADINGVEFIFEIGDILVGDSIIQFIDKPDTIVYTSSNELNEYTRTKSFVLTPSTSFYFTNIYYTVLKSSPDTALSNADAVNFKAELVNANTNQVIGAFDNITYSKNNLQKYASIDYEVDCSGIISGEYYLRLVTSVNTEAEYALANIISDNTTLAKKNFNKVNFTGSEIPITYELSNNYPNPFNPSTTIRYQIPQDGIVTLKIYDILGSEVATLVNEQKVAGKYEVNFNAINLASGVYIYKIQAGTFVNSKKMILLK